MARIERMAFSAERVRPGLHLPLPVTPFSSAANLPTATSSYCKTQQLHHKAQLHSVALLRHCGVCEVQNQGNADRRAVSACLTGLIGSPSPQVPQQYTGLLFGMGIVRTTKRLKSGAEVPDFQAKHDRPVKVMSKNVQIIMRNGQKCGITRNELWFHQNMTTICQLHITLTQKTHISNIIVSILVFQSLICVFV